MLSIEKSRNAPSGTLTRPIPVQVGLRSCGWGRGTTVTPYRCKRHKSWWHWADMWWWRSLVKGEKETNGSKHGILCFIGVVIQSNEVETRLDLIAAPTKHVISASALTAQLITPAGGQKVRADWETISIEQLRVHTGATSSLLKDPQQTQTYCVHSNTHRHRWMEKMLHLHLLVINGASNITVAWPASIHVITKAPVLRLSHRQTHKHTRQRCVMKSFPTSRHVSVNSDRGSFRPSQHNSCRVCFFDSTLTQRTVICLGSWRVNQ